jgi:glycosyltransferase involved in cell wall biosynthesis
MHDMWPFTGGCHYDNHCEGFKKNCGNCPVLQSEKPHDLSRDIYKIKAKAYSQVNNLTMVGCSQWITQCAKESTLLKDKNMVTIPNCINTDMFKKINQNSARDVFGIPKNKKVILFSAMDLLDPRKGAIELFDAINLLDADNAVFVINGSSKPEKPSGLKCPVYFIPPLHDEVSLHLMYNVADVMIVPSLQENLANSIVESLACSVPVVAFDIGGNKDMIDHKKNGYLAKMNDSIDLAKGIEWAIYNKDAKGLALRARAKVISTFDSKIVSKQYIDLYKRILSVA